MVEVLTASETIRGSRGLQEFAHAPNVSADASGHGWRHAKRFVDPAEIVEGEPKRNRCPMVLPFLRKRICEPGEPAHAHPRTEVAALHGARADAGRIGTAHNWDFLRGCDLSGAVAGFAFRRGAVHLDEHGE